MLLTAHLYDAIALKRRAAEFIRKQIATTGSGGFIKSAGWRELCKHPTLVQFLVGEAVNGTGE
jgi:hypothetical protein